MSQREIARISRKSRGLARGEHGNSKERAWILRGTSVGFARNVIPLLFQRERKGCKCRADCTVNASFSSQITAFQIVTCLYNILLNF